MRTYPQRRKWILQDSPCPSVTEILSDYPLLKRSTYVSLLFSNNAHHMHVMYCSPISTWGAVPSKILCFYIHCR